MKNHFKKPVSLPFLLLFVFIMQSLCSRDLQQDLSHFESQLLQKPDDPDVNYNMAQVYFLMGKTDEAIRFLERTIFLDPNDSQSMLRLASIYRKIGKLAEARKILLSAISLSSENVDIWYELGVVYSDLADYSSGIAAFQKALHLSRSEDQKYQIIYYTGLLHLSNRDWTNFKDCRRRLRGSEKFYPELERLGKLWKNQ